MSKLTGTVIQNDLEGGMLMLETDKGERYQLTGKVDGLEAGKKVTVEGKVERDTMGIGMAGPTLKVDKVTVL
jgi:hypothetical protein